MTISSRNLLIIFFSKNNINSNVGNLQNLSIDFQTTYGINLEDEFTFSKFEH